MLLLNIADIHFRHPICTTNMDEDHAYRTELVNDAQHMVNKLGTSVDAILVGGDIAFKGIKEEYDEAEKWLNQLANACGCDPAMIYVVPGNHDVNRESAKSNSVRNVQQSIRNAALPKRKAELYNQFSDAKTGRDLLAPLEAYNNFAATYNCQVFSPERIFWQTGYQTENCSLNPDLDLGNDVKLRLFGLSSTILSGIEGKDDRRLELYLSPLQTVLNPEKGVVNAIICHHPPDWLEDIDEVEDAICGRAALQFFGHKHRQRVHRDYNFIRFSAGAVNPDRAEGAWEPGYNLVGLRVVDDCKRQYLEIEAHLRVWQTNPDGFRAKMQSLIDNDDVLKHRLPIKWSEHRPAVVEIDKPNSTVATVFPAPAKPSAENSMGEKKSRNIVRRFWKLSQSDKRQIALDLGLITKDDISSMPEAERYGRALLKAHQEDLLNKLDEAIKRKEAS